MLPLAPCHSSAATAFFTYTGRHVPGRVALVSRMPGGIVAHTLGFVLPCPMPPPAAPALVAEAIALARTLGSAEAAYTRLRARGEPVSARGVRNWIAKEAGAPAARAVTPQKLVKVVRPIRPSPTPSKLPPLGPVPVPPDSDGGDDAPGSDRPDLPDGLRVDVAALGWEALARLADDVKTFRAKARADDAPKLYAVLVRLELDVHERIERLRPPPEVDPELDPGNVAAADLLLRRLAGLVESAEGRAVA